MWDFLWQKKNQIVHGLLRRRGDDGEINRDVGQGREGRRGAVLESIVVLS